MTKTIHVEISDGVYGTLEAAASSEGKPLSAVASEWLARAASAQPKPLTAEERQAALAELMKFAGCFSSGDPNSADNDRIDRDLEAEYDDPHIGDG
jgi:hypothetical protein